ncbi:MAG: hypothetical protein DIU71_09845 [Proteobacteria bacterium]|nr:MAG: hypothetical protein DIU71_09845 [Pseudomonadota bacterium]
MNRRDVLRLLPSVAATLALPGAALARRRGSDLEVTDLGERLFLISGGGGNVTVFDSPEGALLVDGGAAEHAADILELVRARSRAGRVHTLFNTHWHRDQTGANLALGSAGTRIVAHENTRLWMSTEVNCKWEGRVYERLPVEAHPNETFYTSGSLDFGGERIDYGYLPQAHTDGDIYVFFREANVLVCGDVIASDAWPVIDWTTHGWIGGLVDATQTLLELGDANTKFVPGKGRVLSRADVQTLHEVLATMKQRLARLLAQGMSVQDMIEAAPAREFEARWGDPSLFIANAYPGMVARYTQLGVSIV